MVLKFGKYPFIMQACLIGNIKYFPHVVLLNTLAVSFSFPIILFHFNSISFSNRVSSYSDFAFEWELRISISSRCMHFGSCCGNRLIKCFQLTHDLCWGGYRERDDGLRIFWFGFLALIFQVIHVQHTMQTDQTGTQDKGLSKK